MNCLAFVLRHFTFAFLYLPCLFVEENTQERIPISLIIDIIMMIIEIIIIITIITVIIIIVITMMIIIIRCLSGPNLSIIGMNLQRLNFYLSSWCDKIM